MLLWYNKITWYQRNLTGSVDCIKEHRPCTDDRRCQELHSSVHDRDVCPPTRSDFEQEVGLSMNILVSEHHEKRRAAPLHINKNGIKGSGISEDGPSAKALSIASPICARALPLALVYTKIAYKIYGTGQCPCHGPHLKFESPSGPA